MWWTFRRCVNHFLLNWLLIYRLLVILVGRVSFCHVESIEAFSLMPVSMRAFMLLLLVTMFKLSNLFMKRLSILLRWQAAGLVSLSERPTIDLRAILMGLDIWE